MLEILYIPFSTVSYFQTEEVFMCQRYLVFKSIKARIKIEKKISPILTANHLSGLALWTTD